MGYDVSIPLTESAAYDLVVDDGHQLARVQCKFASDRRRQYERTATPCRRGDWTEGYTTRTAWRPRPGR